MKKVFVGGYEGSGTRVCQMIAERAGYYIGPSVPITYDFGGLQFVELYDHYFKTGDITGLRNFISFYTSERTFGIQKDKESWCIKHGHLMYMIPQLKEWYPDCKFVLVVRNPIDNVLNDSTHHYRYGGMDLNADIYDKLKYYRDVHFKAIKGADYLIKLEDFCYDSYETIKKFLTFLELSDDPNHYMDLVKTPPTIGRGKMYYNIISDPIVDLLGYGKKI